MNEVCFCVQNISEISMQFSVSPAIISEESMAHNQWLQYW